MAISNVDVNFKVKIDIYTLEIMPKEIKHSKSTSLASTSKFFSPFKNTLFHSNHDSNTGNFGSSTNSNHHYNEQNSLGVSSGGAKTSNFIHIDTIEITNKDLSSNRFKLSVSITKKLYGKILYLNLPKITRFYLKLSSTGIISGTVVGVFKKFNLLYFIF